MSFSLIALPLLLSCSQAKENPKANTTPLVQQIVVTEAKDIGIEKGVVVPKVYLKNNSSQSYALYLPAVYSTDKKYPVIYFFDPHNEGLLPVEKYKGLAEKYDFVIACSNNSKNGLAIDIAQQIASNMMDDVEKRFSIDNERIYAGGFSGGARVAASLALDNNKIKGIICCGAGLPRVNKSLPGNFIFMGVAGNGDFNLLELKMLDRAMEGSSIKHELITFNGKHEWPPENTMEQAFLFLDFDAMRSGKISKNEKRIEAFNTDVQKEITAFSQQKNTMEYRTALNKAVNFLDGLADVSSYKNQLAEIEQSIEWVSVLNKQIEVESAELKRQQGYLSAFINKDMEWWEKEIKMLKASDHGNDEKALETKRLLGYLGLAAYMYSGNALNADRYPEAKQIIGIYAMLEPHNAEHFYMSAQLNVKTGFPDKALTDLKSAIKEGFSDFERLNNDPVFVPLKNTKGFMEIKSKWNK